MSQLLTLDDYVAAVQRGEFPDNPKVPTERAFVNENGSLRNLVYGEFAGGTLISSTPNSIRSNHYHKTDWHYLTVIQGIVRYYWRPVGSKKEPSSATFRADETFFTPPMVEHAVLSVNNTVMVSFSRIARRPADHDSDLMKSPLLAWKDKKLVTIP